MSAEADAPDGDVPDVLDPFRQFFSFRRDVLVLSVAMFAFSLAFQITTRFMPRYMSVLGASAFVIGLFRTVQNIIGAAYPYPGGALSDRIGSRRALTLFGLLSSLGFLVWLVVPLLGSLPVVGGVEPWFWVFVGLFFAQAWKSFGLGASFAIVKQAVPPSHLARGFASTEVFRRTAFLVGPLLAATILALTAEFTVGFQVILAVAILFAVAATTAQHVLYEPEDTTIGKSFEGLSEIAADLRGLPPELRPLLVADTLVRFANGLVYVFFIIVVTELREVGLALGALRLTPDPFFGVLLAVEMSVALVSMPVAARLAESVGLKPVVALGFAVYGLFPALLIGAPASPAVFALLFAFSGLRFAGLPAHKALIVGPAERDTGGRVAGSYYLARNTVVIPSAVLGGALYGGFTVPFTDIGYAGSPTLAFALATVVGVAGTAYFLLFGREFSAYE
ncbi:MAG: MFS transporter [Halovenus sp.]